MSDSGTGPRPRKNPIFLYKPAHHIRTVAWWTAHAFHTDSAQARTRFSRSWFEAACRPPSTRRVPVIEGGSSQSQRSLNSVIANIAWLALSIDHPASRRTYNRERCTPTDLLAGRTV